MPTTETQTLEELSINTIRILSADAVQTAKFRPSRHADGRGGHGIYALDAVPEVQSRQIRTGSIATASSSRPGMARCCSTACCISPATICRSTNSNASASGAARRRAIRSAGIRWAWKSPPGRWGRASATASAWRLRRHGSPRAYNRPGHTDRRSLHLRHLRRWRFDGRHHAGSRLARRASAAGQADLSLRPEPHLARRRAPICVSPKMSRRGSQAYGWHTQHVADGNDTAEIAKRDRRSAETKSSGRR